MGCRRARGGRRWGGRRWGGRRWGGRRPGRPARCEGIRKTGITSITYADRRMDLHTCAMTR